MPGCPSGYFGAARRVESGVVSSDPVPERPAICLNMIVRNEAHIVCETLDSVAPYISSWVIVDTGSDDGTQDLIREHMAQLGIPGELHERPWRNFGHNRSEALALARGHGDYIWVIDADDLLVGSPDFTGLGADAYFVRYLNVRNGTTILRQQVFRDGLRWRFEGVVHETPVCDDDARPGVSLGGEYHIAYRQLGSRSQDPQKYVRDAELLLAEVERNPDDVRSMMFLAQSYRNIGDWANSRKWNERMLRVLGPGRSEGTYYAMYDIAQAMSHLGEPWPDVEDAFLRAWENRPTRAEPLHAIASKYRVERRFQLGYLYAKRAAEIPRPQWDGYVLADIYTWRAVDEQAICAFWLGKHTEAFALCRRLVAIPEVPDDARQRITSNRDYSVPALLEAASAYPEALAGELTASIGDGDVTVSLVAGPDRATTEQALNTFLNCCTDVDRIRRFLVLEAGLTDADRTALAQRYGFIEFAAVRSADGPETPPERIRALVDTRFWLHLGQGWRFFAPEAFLTRLTAVLDADERIVQVGINFADSTELTGACAPEDSVCRAPAAGRYVLTDVPASGPAMFDTTRVDLAIGLRTASLDEVLCTKAKTD